MARVQAHAHKLKRHLYKSTGSRVFYCVLSDCSFKTEVQFTLGKKVICWRCGREFAMNEYSIRLAKPHCSNCTRSKSEDKEITSEVIGEAIAAESSMSLRDRLNKISTGVAEREEDI